MQKIQFFIDVGEEGGAMEGAHAFEITQTGENAGSVIRFVGLFHILLYPKVTIKIKFNETTDII